MYSAHKQYAVSGNTKKKKKKLNLVAFPEGYYGVSVRIRLIVEMSYSRPDAVF